MLPILFTMEALKNAHYQYATCHLDNPGWYGGHTDANKNGLVIQLATFPVHHLPSSFASRSEGLLK